ncbi:MAG: DUF5318 family protein [Mycobacteriales bacterium]
MSSRTAIVDYALQRRALLAGVRAGRVSPDEVCDAHPYLQRAATYHGEASATTCPMCRREQLTTVRYIYGDELRHVSGQAKTAREIDAIADAHPGFTVYVVEVCRGCSWNHLLLSYIATADPVPEAGRSERRDRRRRVQSP